MIDRENIEAIDREIMHNYEMGMRVTGDYIWYLLRTKYNIALEDIYAIHSFLRNVPIEEGDKVEVSVEEKRINRVSYSKYIIEFETKDCKGTFFVDQENLTRRLIIYNHEDNSALELTLDHKTDKERTNWDNGLDWNFKYVRVCKNAKEPNMKDGLYYMKYNPETRKCFWGYYSDTQNIENENRDLLDIDPESKGLVPDETCELLEVGYLFALDNNNKDQVARIHYLKERYPDKYPDNDSNIMRR